MRATGTQSCTHFISLSIPLLGRAEDSGISTSMDATIWQITGSQISCSSTTTPVTKWKNHSFSLSFIPCSCDLEKETPILPSSWNSTWIKFQGAQLEGILPSFGHGLSTFSKTMTNHHHICAPTWHFLGYDHRLHLYLLETSSKAFVLPWLARNKSISTLQLETGTTCNSSEEHKYKAASTVSTKMLLFLFLNIMEGSIKWLTLSGSSASPSPTRKTNCTITWLVQVRKSSIMILDSSVANVALTVQPLL